MNVTQTVTSNANQPKVYHYMSYLPSYHFGMSEDQFVEYSSSHEPRGLVLAKLREELGWKISIHIFTDQKSRIETRLPINVPIHFHLFTGHKLLTLINKIPFLQKRILRFGFSIHFILFFLKVPPNLLIFRGNMDSLPSQLLARWLSLRGQKYIYEHHSANVLISDNNKQFLRGASKLFVLTNETKRLIVNGYGLAGKDVVVMPNGVSVNSSLEGVPPLDSTFPRLIFIGMLTHAKGLDLAVKALAIVKQTWANAHLEIAGQALPSSKNFVDDVMTYVKNNGLADNVTLHGWMDHEKLGILLNKASLLVFPSRPAAEGGHEGEPRVVLEAMAWGIPVVGIHDSGGHCDLINMSGTGALAPDASLFPKTVFEYLSNATKIKQDRIDARKYVEENHSIQRVYELYKSSCLEVLEDSN